MALDILLILLLVLANGLFSMSEMAIVAARKSRLEDRADRGSSSARMALSLANSPNEFLATVQIGITVVGTLASAVGGATLAEKLAGHLDQFAWIAPHGEAISLAIVVALISYVSLVVGELVPKRVALQSPERISTLVAPVMRAIAYISTPAVRFLGASTELVLRLIPTRHSTEAEVTEEEIKGLIDQAVTEGTVQPAEKEMVQGVFRLGDRRVNQIMTPRTRIVWLDVSSNTEELLAEIMASHYSTFPVCENSPDNVLGTVDTKDLLPSGVKTQSLDLRGALKTPLVVPDTMPAVRLISLFQKTRNHVALAVDEHGSTQGIVTLNDILEAIVGDIPAHGQAEPPGAVKRADGTWLVDGIMPLVQAKEVLQLPNLPEPDDITTIAGLVLSHLERMPTVGDAVEVGTTRLEVVDMDGSRIDKLLIRTGDNGENDTPDRDNA